MSFALRLLFLCSIFVASQASAAPEIPPLTGRVVDLAGLLSPASEAELSSLLAAHESKSSNQVVVLTVPDLQGHDIAGFALETAREWALGQDGRDNGVLILIAKKEKKMRIEVGYGLEGDLPDAWAKRIIQSEMRPAFKQGDFDGGIMNGTQAVVGAIEGSYTPAEPKESGKETLFIPLGLVSIIGLSGLLKGKVPSQYLNGGIGGSFAGGMVGLATGTWYLGVLAALAFGLFLAFGRSGGGGAGGTGVPRSDRRSSFGSSGGGFSGGGGGFGGGGASGGW